MSQPSSSVGKGYDMAEFDDQEIFKYLNHAQSPFLEHRNQTLNIFPSQPMHSVDPSIQVGGALANGSISKGPVNQSMGVPSTQRKSSNPAPPATAGQAKPIVKTEGSKKARTSSSEQDAPKTPDPKTLRRLAQNREAARKSRLRKKAYIQQLETSKMKLHQLEQQVQMATSQGMILGGGVLTAEAALFDMHYKSWMEEHHKLMFQLSAALEEQLPENQLQLLVGSALSHYEVLFNIKGALARSDVFHLMTGTWMSPAERCFLWIGGHRPGELIKIVLRHIEPLTEQQIVSICNLQQSVQETEDAVSQGVDAVHRSVSEIISNALISSAPDMTNLIPFMSISMSKLASLEVSVTQADSLRLQTLRMLSQILTARQSARCLLVITEYFHRLRTLSNLWVSRPRQEESASPGIQSQFKNEQQKLPLQFNFACSNSDGPPFSG